MAEWVELTGEVSPRSGAKPQGGRPESGIRLAARQLPVPGDTEKAREHQIARALKVASLSSEAQDAARSAAAARAIEDDTPRGSGLPAPIPWSGDC